MKRRIALLTALLLTVCLGASAAKGFKSMEAVTLAGDTRTAEEWLADEESREELVTRFACDAALKLTDDDTGDFAFDWTKECYAGLSDGILNILLPGQAQYVYGLYEPLTGELSYSLYDVSLADTLIASVQDACGTLCAVMPEGIGEAVEEALEDLG